MNEDIASRLQDLPPDLPDQPDRFELVRGRVVRRRRRRAVVGSVLAAAVVVAGVSVATAGNSPRQDDRVDAADQSDAPGTQPFPDPPLGSKWVGMNNLVVAVPAEWPVLDSPCGDGSPGVVLNGTNSATTKCRQYPSEVASVSLVPLKGSQPSESGQPSCSRGGFARGCWANRAFVDEGVLVRVQFYSPDTVSAIDRILSTAMVLPDGWTTVPFGGEDLLSTRRDVLAKAGFSIDSGMGSLEDGPWRTVPESGSPVREGATITLVPLDSPPGGLPPNYYVETKDLTVVLDRLGADEQTLAAGTARWNASERTVTYRPRSTVFNTACEPVTNVSIASSSVTLVFEVFPNRDVDCPNEYLDAVATISGLNQAPTGLTVTEDGEARTVPVEQSPAIDLAGSWEVALPDDDTSGLSMTFTGTTVRYTVGCVDGYSDYTASGDDIRFTNGLVDQPGCIIGAPLPVVIGKARHITTPTPETRRLLDADNEVLAVLTRTGE